MPSNGCSAIELQSSRSCNYRLRLSMRRRFASAAVSPCHTAAVNVTFTASDSCVI